MLIKRLLDYILNIIYPPVCGICGKLSKQSICKKCEIFLEKQAVNVVDRDEITSEKYFDELIYIFEYSGLIRKTILDYKFKEKSYLYITLANFLLKSEKIFEILQSYDTIIPVPISKKRYRDRGYNQSYLIAKELSKRLGLYLNNSSLFKTKNIIEQSKLNKENRVKNIKGAFDLKNVQKIEGRKILLVDDIYTTGSTVKECCRVLKKANPLKIGIFTIARD